MNGYNPTSPSAMLTAFIEGDLEGADEDFLFSLLSDNQALRLEMRELLALNRLARTDAERMAPPSAWKGNVLAAIAGVRYQSEESDDDTPAGAGWYRTGAVALFSLLFGILGTLGILYLTDGRNIGDKGIKGETTVSTATTLPTGEASDLSTERVSEVRSGNTSSPPNGQVNRANLRSPSPLPLPVDREDGEEKRDREEERAARQDALNRTSISSPRLADDTLLAESNGADDPDHISSSLPPAFPSNPDVWRERLEVGYRSSIGTSYPNLSLPSGASGGIGDMSLTLLYPLNDHLRLGLEVGRAEFPQIFRGVENGDRIRYEQNPTLFWYALACDYTADELLFDGLHPFARLAAGGTAAGPLGRGVLGVKFIPERRIAITAGIEGSAMLYEFQKTWFSSRGLDFTYGFSIKF